MIGFSGGIIGKPEIGNGESRQPQLKFCELLKYMNNVVGRLAESEVKSIDINFLKFCVPRKLRVKDLIACSSGNSDF